MKLPETSNDISGDELWQKTAKALDGGDFSRLDNLLTRARTSIVDLLETNGDPREYMEEAFAWACFTGRTGDAEALLDKGVDPAAGFGTGMAGFHWAANRGNLETVEMLIRRKAQLEQKNMYDGTVLGCTLWSAVHEHRNSHAAIIEALIKARAVVEKDSLEWWEAQRVSSEETKRRVADALRNAEPK